MSTTYLYLNTRNSISPETPGDTTFQLNMRFNEKSAMQMAIEQVSFPVTVYPVNSYYNTLVFEEDGGAATTVITIPEGNYTGTQFAATLQDEMNTNTQRGTVYQVNYDSQNKKLSIQTDGNDFQILKSSSCLHILGENEKVGMTSAVNSYVFPHPVRLDGTAYVDIQSSMSTNNISSNGRTNIVGRVFITASWGYINEYSQARESLMNFYNIELSSLTLKLVDDRGNPYKLPTNSDVSYAIKLISL